MDLKIDTDVRTSVPNRFVKLFDQQIVIVRENLFYIFWSTHWKSWIIKWNIQFFIFQRLIIIMRYKWEVIHKASRNLRHSQPG